MNTINGNNNINPTTKDIILFFLYPLIDNKIPIMLIMQNNMVFNKSPPI